MDIGTLGSLYLDDVRTTASSLGIGKNALNSGLKSPGISGGTAGLPSFGELLERSYGEVSHGEKAALPRPPGSPTPPVNPEEASLPPSHSPKPVVDKTDKLYEQCEALETFMVKILINGMRNTVQKSGLVEEGFAGKMYEDMLYDEYAKNFTQNAGFGLAELAYLELTGQRGKIIAHHS
jgi:flagellar protein FlgJ